jgi:3-dehydroquinate dehydratase-2
MKTIAVIHGPNLDKLGKREPEVYGSTTLDQLNARIQEEAKSLGIAVSFFQSNHEGKLIDEIGKLRDPEVNGIIINPAGYSHTSVALRDALAASGIPAIEVHISNIYKRESFRHNSLTAGACLGVISGFGVDSYLLALRQLTH